VFYEAQDTRLSLVLVVVVIVIAAQPSFLEGKSSLIFFVVSWWESELGKRRGWAKDILSKICQGKQSEFPISTTAFNSTGSPLACTCDLHNGCTLGSSPSSSPLLYIPPSQLTSFEQTTQVTIGTLPSDRHPFRESSRI